MSTRKRQAFSPEYKREAVRLLEQGDKEAAQLARELGIKRNQLYGNPGSVLTFQHFR